MRSSIIALSKIWKKRIHERTLGRRAAGGATTIATTRMQSLLQVLQTVARYAELKSPRSPFAKRGFLIPLLKKRRRGDLVSELQSTALVCEVENLPCQQLPTELKQTTS